MAKISSTHEKKTHVIQIADSACLPPEENMESDARALKNLTPDSLPVLRFYAWSVPSATYGYFLNPWDYFDPKGVEKHSLHLARRPTGGGVILHTHDLAFSLLVPASHPFYSLDPLISYQAINQRVLKAVLKTGITEGSLMEGKCVPCKGGFCMAKPTHFDVLWQGKKIGGAAQRKTKQGLLHQGSIYLAEPDEAFLGDILKDGFEAAKAMREASFPLGTVEQLSDLRDQLKKELIQALR